MLYYNVMIYNSPMADKNQISSAGHQSTLQEILSVETSGESAGRTNARNSQFKSRIPRLIAQSVESNNVKNLTNSTDQVIELRSDAGFANPSFDFEKISAGDRTARYAGKYSSYEEVLANMDNQDPFQGQPSPPRDDLVRKSRERSQERARQRNAYKLADGEGNDASPQAKPRKKKKRSKPQQNVNETLNGTFSVMHDNPNYESYQPQRRASNESTGTFTVSKGGSTKNLIEHEHSRNQSHGTQGHMELNEKQKVTFTDQALTGAQEAGSDGLHNEYDKSDFHRQDTFTELSIPHNFESDSRKQEDIAMMIAESGIKMRQCKKYIKTTKKDVDPTDCCCGRESSWHEDMKIPLIYKKDDVWKMDKHTETVPTNCFGTICFQGFGQEASKNAPYIRIDYTTKPDVIWNLMEKHWKMPKPKLIISVTGGAKRFFLKSRLRNNFKRGLVNVATTTGAWIVTGGTNAGVMEFVGEAVRDYALSSGGAEQKVVAVGIATWGIIDNMDSLMPEKEANDDPPRGIFPADYNCKDLEKKQVRGISPLDPNHTHFLLVDNGQEKKFGAEIEFRAAFENHIANMETTIAKNQNGLSEEWNRVTVPVVLLVLEGGENTIKTAMEAVENNTPVVIIQGSGRAADVLAYAVNYFKNQMEVKKFTPDTIDGKPADEKVYADILQKVEGDLDWTREKDIKEKEKKIFKCVQYIEKMLPKKNLLTVFFLDDIDTTNEIDQAILYSLLKAEKSNFVQQLKLALAWNRCDIARQEIFKNENRLQWQKQMEPLYEAMFTALVQNRVDFVQLFLENGVELKEFLNVRRLRELYDEVVNDRRAGTCSSLLRHLLQRIQSTGGCACCHGDIWDDDLPNLLQIVGKLINNFAGDQYQNLYQDPKYLVREDEHALSLTTTTLSRTYDMALLDGNNTSRSISKRRSRGPKQDPEFEIPEKDLLFWAVLLNRKELALLFWKSGKDHIGGALTACAIFKALGAAAGEEEELDLSNELHLNSNEFEELATGVLNECYQRDKQTAHRLLIRSLDTWGGTTVFSIADGAECMTLMGHSACQTKLNKIWKGKMILYTSVTKIVMGLLLFPLIVPTIRFTSDGHGDFGEKSLHNHVTPSGDDSTQYHPSGKPQKKNEKASKVYTVDAGGCCGADGSVNMLRAYYLYHTAPLVKFCYHTLSYLVFLGLFCFFLLTNMHHPTEGGPGVVECIVWAWAATMILEELRQIATRDPNSLRPKLASYFSSMWNRFDMFVYGMLIVTILLRFVLPIHAFVWARRMYAITLTLFFLRFMQTFYVEKNMGPKVIMIKKMLTDLIFFVLILAVFVFGYGVAVQALRYPNAELSWSILVNVIYMPYWHIYGELFLDEMQSDTGPSCPVPDVNNPSCPEESWLVIILLALYMIFTNVLLLNLLIAMFSYTFERVQENSEKVWRFHRYGLVYEYFDKPTLAPPLIILSHIFRLCKFLRRCCKNEENNQFKQRGRKMNTYFYQELSKKENNKLTAFERVGMDNYLIQRQLLNREHIDAKVASTGERIEKVIEDLEQIKETVTATSDSSNSLPVEATDLQTTRSQNIDRENVGVMQSRISGLQEQLEEQYHQMRDMYSMMEQLRDNMTEIVQVRSYAQPPPASVQPNWGVPLQNVPDNGSRSRQLYQRNTQQQESPYSHRIRRGPHPHIEIQEFPPGYTDT